MGLLGQWALNPFSKPVRPWSTTLGPEQVRGALNQLAKNLTGHDADETLHTVSTPTAAVTTAPLTIYPVPLAQAFALVGGDDGAGNAFVDQVAWHPSGSAVLVISSSDTEGAPGTRAYTNVSGILTLAMSAGTYAVEVVVTQLG